MDIKNVEENMVHGLFEITMLAKGINGCFEILIGFSFFFFPRNSIHRIIETVTGYKIVRGSGHIAANYVIHLANNVSLSTQYFIATYFLAYGLVNIFLVVFLVRGKIWAYPVAIAFFTLFIFYQFYRFFLHHSDVLLLLTLFDICLVALTWLEYQRIKTKNRHMMLK